MEDGSSKSRGTVKRSPEELFNKFIEAQDCPEILQTFQRLVNAVGVVAETPREFYGSLKSKLQSWKCKNLWELLDNRANQKEYLKGKVCEDIHALVIGCGPIGLRTAIELSLLGAQVVIVEKRKSFTRNNVLHLWPFLLTDFRSLGAKKFYGKFCSGSIDHISIRRLQAVLLKSALILGVKVFTGVTFDSVIEPTNEEDGWKCHVTPFNDALNDFEVDVVIGADGKKNILPGFAQIEMRGTLAIGITANFVNKFTEEEKKVEEISGIAYQFNPAFFDHLKQQKGIKLENIVYYKDETHYFVMTAVKSSLLKRGVLKKDYGNKPLKLLHQDNVDQEKLVYYVNEAVSYATKGQLHNHELKRDDKGKADIAVFDFTSIKKAENSARIIERKGHKLLLALVGDSLLEPFWPTGSGCARGVLSALDAAWMIRSFAQDKPPLQILSERENIYRLLSGTSNENMHKNFAAYTINPSSRYTHIPQKKIQEVYHLYDTDDPVNADFSMGSPQGVLSSRGIKPSRVSTAIKPHYRPSKKHIKLSSPSPSYDLKEALSSSASSLEDLDPNRNRKKPSDSARQRSVSEALTSGGEEITEITTKKNKWGKRPKKTAAKSPVSPRTTVTTKPPSGVEKGKSKKPKMTHRMGASPASAAGSHEKSQKRRSFFGFGRIKSKSRAGKKSPRLQSPIAVDDNQIKAILNENCVASSKTDQSSKEKSSFTRNQPQRRSAREIIAEIEARNKNTPTKQRKGSLVKQSDRSLKEIIPDTGNRAIIKRTTSEPSIYQTPQNKQSKTDDLWKEIESMSPCAKGAVPALSTMNPDFQSEDDPLLGHSDLSSAMRIAGLMAMATPLLASNCKQQEVKNLPWYSKTAGRVKETISKYDSLTSRRFGGLAGDGTPIRRPSDRVDSSERKPTLAEVAQRIMSREKNIKDDEVHLWQPTAIAVVEGKTGPNHAQDQSKSRDKKVDKLRLLEKELSSLDQESTDSPDIKKDLSSSIYQKTFIADLKAANQNKNDKNDNDVKDSISPVKQIRKQRDLETLGRRQTVAKNDMEQYILNLTETTSQERAETSIRFLISMFRRIQRNPKDDKFRRIFKSRVKFKKFVWTVRNAKMFLLASGWIEVGSFLLFPVEKNVREPLAILQKYLGLLESGSTVQISTIKSTPRRKGSQTTPLKAEFTSDNQPPEQTSPDVCINTALDKRFSRSVPQNLNNECSYDLEMEDPLCQTSNGKSHQATRKTSSALETRSPATPDFAVIEELEELSNTLDDLMESLGDSSDNSPKVSEIQSPSVREIKDLCTTIDYLLDTSEEEQLNREFNALETRPKDETNVEHSKSAFTKVLTPSQKRRILPSEPKLHVDKAVAVVDKAPTVSLSSESNKNSQQIARKASDSNVNKNRRHDSKARRRKLPQQPVAKSRPSEESSEPTKGKAPTGKENEARLARQISQESLTLIKRRFGSESNLSSLKYDSKEEPKRYNKTDKLKEGIRSQSKNKSLPSNKRTSSESGSSTNVRKAALKKAQSEVDVSHNQQLKKDQSSIKNVSADSFKKPTVQEASERTSVSRQSSRSESLNSDGSSNVKGRPPSGVGMRTRSTRAKKRQEIVQKLECLETSLNSLEKSPKKKSSRNSSTSSSTSRLSAKDVAVTSSTRKLDLHRTNSFGCKTSENIKNTSTLRTRSQSASASTTNGAAKGKARTAGKTGTKAQLPAPVQTKEKESKIAKEKIVASKKAENVANVTNGPEKSKESGKMNGKVTKEKRIVSEMNNHDKMKRSVGEVGIPSNPAPEIITDRVCKDDKENTVDNMQDESKVQIKLKDTGSWMVLDYEGRANGSEPSTRNNSVSSQASQFSVHTNTDDVIATSNTLITVNPREPLDNEESCKKVNGDVVIAEEALQDGEMVRHNALRTRKTRRKVETQNALSFGNGKEKLPVKNSTAKTSKNEKSTKGPKNKGNISFGIRKKKITESCHEINGKLTTDTHVNTPNSPLNRSLEKKKHSPFKLLAIKRKSSESQSLKNA